jgi:hypothetical protein
MATAKGIEHCILNQDVGIDVHYMRWWCYMDCTATNSGTMSIAWQFDFDQIDCFEKLIHYHTKSQRYH